MTYVRVRTTVRILCTLVFVTGFALLAHAQTVDPCSYGCPKDGCPQCNSGGGPIDQGSGTQSGSQTGSSQNQ